jgi:hypothetical protein
VQQGFIQKRTRGSTLAPLRDKPVAFFLALFTLIVGSACLAGYAPIAFTLITVAVFGAPHNFSEFRYFLSKLPSRLASLKKFFIAAFSGTIILFSIELALMYAGKTHGIAHYYRSGGWAIWNESILVWLIALAHFRYRFDRSKSIEFTRSSGPAFGMATVANLMSPALFTYGLTYLHPMLSLWIFERELRRSNKQLLPVYHKILLLVPLAVAGLCIALWNSPTDSAFGFTLNSFVDTARNTTTTTTTTGQVPVKLLLAIFAFLQMVHYGIWCFGMPILTEGWKKWRLDSIAILRDRTQLRAPLFLASIGGVLIVAAFWLSFVTNYEITNEVYLTLTTFHVLAEIPFMFWMCEG